MYICSCRAVTKEAIDKKLKEKKGVPLDKTLVELGVGQDCGICLLNCCDELGNLKLLACASRSPSDRSKKKLSA